MKKLKCILLVDDDPTVMFIHTSLINRLGVVDEILTAKNGKEALELLNKHCQNTKTAGTLPPDLILLDISMPVMNGFEFLKEFEEMELRHRPIVALLTNSMNPKDKSQAAQFNLAEMLNKPLTSQTLSKLLQKHFNIGSLENATRQPA